MEWRKFRRLSCFSTRFFFQGIEVIPYGDHASAYRSYRGVGFLLTTRERIVDEEAGMV